MDETSSRSVANSNNPVDTLRYFDTIKEFIPSLHKLEGATGFALCLRFDMANKIILSSNPGNIASSYYAEDLELGNTIFNSIKYQKQDYYIPSMEKRSIIEKAFDAEIQMRFNCHTAYSMYRSSQECDVISVLLYNKPVENPLAIYKKTIHKFEDFVIDFLDKILPEIKKDKFFLEQSNFLQDANLRKNIIKNKHIQINETLTPMERKTLYLASLGLGSKESAVRLKISEHTVKKYLKNIRGKLDAKSTAHAASIIIRNGAL